MQPQFVPAVPAALPGGGMLLPNGAPLLNGGVPAPAMPLVQPGGGLGMLPGGFAGAAPMAAPVAAPPFGLGGLGGAPLGMPSIDLPLDPTGVGGFGTASVSLSAGLGRGGDEAASAEGGAGGGKGRNKTAKQQEANKIAQQRYRERKKVGRQGCGSSRALFWPGAGAACTRQRAVAATMRVCLRQLASCVPAVVAQPAGTAPVGNSGAGLPLQLAPLDTCCLRLALLDICAPSSRRPSSTRWRSRLPH